MVEREDVRDGFVHVFRLIQQRLPVERGHILVEIHHEKVQTARSGRVPVLVVPNHIVIMPGGLRSQGSDLSVTASIAGKK
jgi:hypothetical protein